MSKDFSSDTGGIQSSDSTIFSEHQDAVAPYTGFIEAPVAERAPTGPGPGVGASSRKIH